MSIFTYPQTTADSLLLLEQQKFYNLLIQMFFLISRQMQFLYQARTPLFFIPPQTKSSSYFFSDGCFLFIIGKYLLSISTQGKSVFYFSSYNITSPRAWLFLTYPKATVTFYFSPDNNCFSFNTDNHCFFDFSQTTTFFLDFSRNHSGIFLFC